MQRERGILRGICLICNMDPSRVDMFHKQFLSFHLVVFYHVLNINEAPGRMRGGFQVENQCLFLLGGSWYLSF